MNSGREWKTEIDNHCAHGIEITKIRESEIESKMVRDARHLRSTSAKFNELDQRRKECDHSKRIKFKIDNRDKQFLYKIFPKMVKIEGKDCIAEAKKKAKEQKSLYINKVENLMKCVLYNGNIRDNNRNFEAHDNQHKIYNNSSSYAAKHQRSLTNNDLKSSSIDLRIKQNQNKKDIYQIDENSSYLVPTHSSLGYKRKIKNYNCRSHSVLDSKSAQEIKQNSKIIFKLSNASEARSLLRRCQYFPSPPPLAQSSSPPPVPFKHGPVVSSKVPVSTYIPMDFEKPRISILDNFKAISRVMRVTFNKNKMNRNMIAQASLYNSPFGIGAASNSNNNLSTEEERERKKSEEEMEDVYKLVKFLKKLTCPKNKILSTTKRE